MSNDSYAHLGCATVIFGGFGMVLCGVGLDGLRLGNGLIWYLPAGVAVWGFLAFLWWVNVRANNRRAWLRRQPYAHLAEPHLPKGGFLKGAVLTWLVVVAAHVASFFVLFGTEGDGAARMLAQTLYFDVLPLAHLVVPIAGGFLHSLVVSTSTPK